MEQTRRRQSFSPYSELDNRSKENKMEMLSNLHFEESVDTDKPRCPSRREQLLYEAEVWSTELKASKLSLPTTQERATKRTNKTSSSSRGERASNESHVSFSLLPSSSSSSEFRRASAKDRSCWHFLPERGNAACSASEAPQERC